MATHTKTTVNEIIKTFTFKVKSINNVTEEKLLLAIDEYQKYYNKCSDWIKSHLNDKIGDLINFIPEDKKSESKYIKTLISEEWKDKPMYMMFKKSYPANDRDNALYLILSCINPEEYNGNILGFSVTYYRRNGYIASVISNYVTKISKMATGAQRHNLNDDADDKAISEQVIYEMEHRGWTSEKDWKEHIEYLDSKSDYNEKHTERMKKLFGYYISHIEDINTKMETMAIEALIKFGGCRRNASKKSMFIMGTSNTPFNISQINGNFLNIKFSNLLNLDVYGRRDVIKDGQLLFDIDKNHGDSFILKVVNGNIYIDINSKVPFEKNISSTNKVVGVDVNIKHMLLATDIPDNGSIKNYINIYEEVLRDIEFRKTCPDKILKCIEEFSKFVSFGPLEFDFLFSRICTQKGMPNEYSELETAFSNVLYRLKAKFNREGDNTKRIYVENILKLRSQIKAYVIIKNAYYTHQGEYDIDKTEDYIHEHPFSETECGREMLEKLNRIEQKIIGCRNNIIQYAYMVFSTNGYDMISLEKLTSSQFEKIKTIPSVRSLLNYHKVLGCTDAEVSEKEIYSIIKKGYFDFTYEEGKIIDAKLSAVGKLIKIKDDFFNLMIKSIHFAEIKDYFITLSNNGNVGVSLVPSYFTSQMNSLEHKIYCEHDKKTGNLKLVHKRKVRREQEYHINGLNADYNAAKNIGYLTSDEKMRNMFLRPANTNKSMYNKPSYETFVKSQASVVSKLKKEGMVSIIDA